MLERDWRMRPASTVYSRTVYHNTFASITFKLDFESPTSFITVRGILRQIRMGVKV